MDGYGGGLKEFTSASFPFCQAIFAECPVSHCRSQKDHCQKQLVEVVQDHLVEPPLVHFGLWGVEVRVTTRALVRVIRR